MPDSEPTSAPREMSELYEAADYLAVRRLQHRYADAITRRAWHDLGSILDEDCELSLDLGDRTLEVSGRSEIGSFIARAVERFTFFEFAVLSTVVDLEPPDSARSRLWMVELRQNADDGRRTNAFGVYQDRLTRTPAGWRFTHRRYSSVSRTADPGHHEDQIVFDPTIIPLDQL